MVKPVVAAPPKIESVTVMPPHNDEAEEAVVGSMLIDPMVIGDVSKILSPSDFWVIKIGWVYEALVNIAAHGDPIDFLTVCNELEQQGKLAEVGGQGYITQLINAVPSAMHADGYARMVKGAAVRRIGLSLCADFAERLYDEKSDVFVSFDKFHQRAVAIRSNEAARMGGEIPVVSADAVMAAQYPEPYVAVEGMLTSGLAVLGAKPKMHKSWMAMQLLCAIASPTGNFLGRKLEHGKTLYITLELTLRELQKRMKAQRWPASLAVDVITTETYQERIGNIARAGADTLCRLMLEKDYRVAVIDPFNLAMAYSDADMYDLVSMAEVLARLQKFGVEHDRVIMFVMHHPKELRESHDPITDVMGTIGVGASIGTAWGVYRERGQQMAEMVIAGRSLPEELALAVRFDGELCAWIYEGKACDLVMTEQRVEILRVLDLNGPQSHKQICELVGKDGGNVTRRLGDLMREELVEEVITGGKKNFRSTEEGKRKLDEFDRSSSHKG